MRILPAMVMITFSAVVVFDSAAQAIGNCPRSLGEAELNVNNVRARILNTGGLFYRGEPHVYNVPRLTNGNAIFASNLWIGGKVNNELFVSASRYGEWQMWAGPIDDDGNPPDDCGVFDRVYSVRRTDIEHYDSTGEATPDLSDWPTGLGAPTLDANGDPIDLLSLPLAQRFDRTINLAAGERPAIRGDQTIWWIMNDRGNEHTYPSGLPLGVEVHGMAFAARSGIDAINNSTVYRYRIINRNDSLIQDAWIGFFVDADLGDFADDYIGADTLLQMGYTYNSDNNDADGREAYGSPPPALGIVVLEGPLADDDVVDNDYDRAIDEAGEQLAMTHFMYFNSGGGNGEDPQIPSHYYNYMQELLKDGQPLRYGGRGYDPDTRPTNHIWPGDPVRAEFWSEVNLDSAGTRRAKGDRRFLVSTGPFDLDPGENTVYTFAVVWALGRDNLDSITELRKAAVKVREAFDAGYKDFPPGRPPQETVELLSPGNGVTEQSLTPSLFWAPLTGLKAYQVEVISTEGITYYSTDELSLELDPLPADALYYWRVRLENIFGFGPWSELRHFTSGDASFSVPPWYFTVVQNAAGPLDPPDLGAFAINSSGFPTIPCPLNPSVTCLTPTRGYQQSTNNSIWGIHAAGASAVYGPLSRNDGFLLKVTYDSTPDLFDYEWRFTGLGTGGLGIDNISGDGEIVDLGFEIWNIGSHTPDDPSDDYRMIPTICSHCYGNDTTGAVDEFHIGGDHLISDGNDDPQTTAVYLYQPEDRAPGERGYQSFLKGEMGLGERVLKRLVLVQLDGGTSPPYAVPLPETGTIFRISLGEIPLPALSAPRIGTELNAGPISLFWNGVPFDRFRVQVSTHEDFTTTVIDTVMTETLLSDSLLVNGHYYWRVLNFVGDSSPVWSFDIRGGASGVATEADGEFPARFKLLGNYPNPFREATMITYELPRASRVKLELFDAVGRRVRTLVDAKQAAGKQEYEFKPGSLPSGVYFYTITVGDFRATRSVTVVR